MLDPWLDPVSARARSGGFEQTHELVEVHQDRTCASRITKQLRRRHHDAFVKRRRVVQELKLPPTIGFEFIGVEDGFQDFDDESKALLFCLLTIVWFRLAALALKSRPRLLWNAT